MANQLSQWVLGAVTALSLLAGVCVARQTGIGLAELAAASPVAGAAVRNHVDDCTVEFAGHYFVDEAVVPGYTLTCWDADWNLNVPAPVARW